MSINHKMGDLVLSLLTIIGVLSFLNEQSAKAQEVPSSRLFGDSPLIYFGTPSLDRRVVGITYIDGFGGPKRCTGVRIGSRHVLTAKHCTCHSHQFKITDDYNLLDGLPTKWTVASLSARFGAECSRDVPVDATEGKDLAILKLSGSLYFSGSAPCSSQFSLSQIVSPDIWLQTRPLNIVIAGYGDDPSSLAPGYPREEANIGIRSVYCLGPEDVSVGCSTYQEFRLSPNLGNNPRTDSCRGDSGGPAIVKRAGGDYLIGVVSREAGRQPTEGCGAGGIYTHVGRRSVQRWIANLQRLDGNSCSK